MEEKMKSMREIKEIAKKLSKIKNVKAVFLFGSYALGKGNCNSDIDLCIFGNLNKKEKEEVLKYYSDKFDISIFNELPIWIKTRVFRDGKSIFNKDENSIRRIAFKTMHEWEDFKPLIENRVYRRFGKCMI